MFDVHTSSWADLYREPTYEERIFWTAKALAGDYPGPNRWAVALVLAKQLVDRQYV